jgi:signal transduction histidine kinase
MGSNPPARPQSEDQRLAAIERFDILDSPPEATFDRVLDILRAVLGVTGAFLTFVDRDRSFYKAISGIEFPVSTPREDNMCDAVIAQDDVLVIVDSLAAPEELVRPLLKAGMRFYAGAPLRTKEGTKIGTLCAIDPQPRQLNETERQIMFHLSDIVIDELELRLAALQMAQADVELRRLNQELEVISRNKSEFLAAMSHELRTPLNGILGASELLGQGLFGELNRKQSEYVDDIHRSGQHLLHLIEDVLDLSRIEAGQTELRRESIDVEGLMQGCEAIVRGLAESRSINLRVVAPKPSFTLRIDERRIAQVACNLLSNALKFTPASGNVIFSAVASADDVVFTVEDEGPGILPEYAERIFEQFFRVPSDQEGTGLGLALAKQLVELHDGRIWVESRQPAGCRFSFSIPLAGVTSG